MHEPGFGSCDQNQEEGDFHDLPEKKDQPVEGIDSPFQTQNWNAVDPRTRSSETVRIRGAKWERNGWRELVPWKSTHYGQEALIRAADGIREWRNVKYRIQVKNLRIPPGE
jgi:hypothetical protein